MVTNIGSSPEKRKEAKRGPGQVLKVRFGSVSVPIYQEKGRGRPRYVVAHYRDGRRIRKKFIDLDEAKKEARFAAQRIQAGMQHVTDLKPHERDAFVAANKLAGQAGLPLVSAMEEFVRAREIAGDLGLAQVAADYMKHFGGMTRRATVVEVAEHLLEVRRKEGVGMRHLQQLRSVLRRFAAAHPGQILDVTSADIDGWLRSLGIAAISRNGMLRYVNLLFSFALEQNYLPEGRPTASSQVRRLKVGDTEIGIFQPDEMRRLLHAAPVHLIPSLAIGAFAGIRVAELGRLDWSAVDLNRRIIELRAGQAKTASRRVVPVTDNLAAWLEPLPRSGRVIPSGMLAKEASTLAKELEIGWPPNVLRHSFISYRLSVVKSADQVALEAGNSPSIIFKHYRELTTEEQAQEWFSILPRPAQFPRI